jgi:predicted chitinase
MDKEVIQNLIDQLEELTNTIGKQGTAMTGMTANIGNANKSMDSITKNIPNNTNSINANTTNNINTTKNLNALSRAIKEAENDSQEFMNNLKTSGMFAASALGSFSKSIMSSDQGFTKFGDTFKSLGSAGKSLGENFGLLGKALGFILDAGGQLLASQAEMADNVGKATDAIAKLGAANKFTMNEVADMGLRVGLTTYELDKMIKPMQSVKGGFVALAGSQAEGVKKFTEVLAVSKDLRNHFRQLGLGDEERNKAIADYISMQNESGAAFSGQLSTTKGVQKAATEFIDKSVELAAIKGQTLDDAMKDYAALMKNRESVLANFTFGQRQNKIDQLSKGNARDQAQAKKEQEALDADQAGYAELTKQLSQTGMPTKQIEAIQAAFTSHILMPDLGELQILGLSVDKYLDAAHRNQLNKVKLGDDYQEAATKFMNDMGMTQMGMKKGTAAGLISTETINRINLQQGKTITEITEQARKEINANKTDPAQQLRDKTVETEREIKTTLDKLNRSINPFLGNGGVYAKLFDALMFGIGTLGTLAIAAGGRAWLGRTFGKTGASGAVSAEVAAIEKLSLKGLGKSLLRKMPLAAAAGLGGYAVSTLFQGSTTKKDSKEPEKTNFDLTGVLPENISESDIGSSEADLKNFKPEKAPVVKSDDTANENLKNINKKIEEATVRLNDLTKKSLEVTSTIAKEKMARQLEMVSKYKIDIKQVENNSKAAQMYAATFGNIEKLNVDLTGVAEAINAFSKISGTVYKDLESFSKIKIDAGQTKTNSEAFSAFSIAMASYKGLSGIADTTSSIAEGVKSFLGVSNVFDTFVTFSNLMIDSEGARGNSEAFVKYSDAMFKYKGGPKLLSTVSQLVGSKLVSLFGENSAIDLFLKFTDKASKHDLGSKKVSDSTQAFLNFSKAMGILGGGITDLKVGQPGTGTEISVEGGKVVTRPSGGTTRGAGGVPSAPSVPNAPGGTGTGQQPEGYTPYTPGATPQQGALGGAPSAGAGMGGRANTTASQNKQLLIKAMNDLGVTSPQERAAMAAVIEGESRFGIKSESSYATTSNARIREVFKSKFGRMSDGQINQLKADPEKFFNYVYGGQLGNSSNEGYLYRGRGFIQLTGKSNYKRYGDMIGVDLVKNPDLISTNPEIAAKVSVAYMRDRRKSGDTYHSIARGVGNAVRGTEEVKIAAYQRNLQSGEFGADKPGQSLQESQARLYAGPVGPTTDRQDIINKQADKPGQSLQESQARLYAGPVGPTTDRQDIINKQKEGQGGKALDSGAQGMMTASERDLRASGIRIKSGDVQGYGFALDSRIISLAKQIQANIPGFMQFNSFNDRFHHKLGYRSKHSEGKAVDFSLSRRPSEMDGRKLVGMLRQMGFSHAIDEYNHPSGAATGGHMHGQLAKEGGIFSGSNSGYPMTMHGTEMVIPKTSENSILAKLAQTNTDITSIGDVMQGALKKDNGKPAVENNTIGKKKNAAKFDLSDLESKFNSVLDVLQHSDSIQDKYYKHTAV